MIQLFNIPEKCIVNKEIPLEKIFTNNNKGNRKQLLWYATIKSEVFPVRKVNTEEKRYEEIQFLELYVDSAENLYGLVTPIFKKIKYHCVIVVNNGDKSIVSICNYKPGKRDYSLNTHRRIEFSHWIHEDLLSSPATQFIENINRAIDSADSLEEMYGLIRNAVTAFPLSGTTKRYIEKILTYFTGGKINYNFNEIMSYCSPRRFSVPMNPSKAAKYNKNMRYYPNVYSYDYEDVWYCLMKYDFTARIIKKQRYRDINDLIYCLNEKWEDEEV